MKKSDYIAEIVKVLNKYLEKFDLTCFYDDEFAYYYASSRISFSFVCSEKSNREFSEVCAALRPEVKADIFLLSMFHEIGHNESYDDLSDKDIDYSQDMKNCLNMEDDMDRMLYYTLPDEKAATLWGLDYMINNREEVEELWNTIQPLIMKYYESVEV